MVSASAVKQWNRFRQQVTIETRCCLIILRILSTMRNETKEKTTTAEAMMVQDLAVGVQLISLDGAKSVERGRSRPTQL